MNTVKKSYFCKNTKELDRAMNLLVRPEFCLNVSRFFIEMDYSEVIVTCLPTQVAGVEHILKKAV